MSLMKKVEKALLDYNKIIDRVRFICGEYGAWNNIDSFSNIRRDLTKENIRIINERIDEKINKNYIPNELKYKNISIEIEYFLKEDSDGSVWSNHDGFKIFFYKNGELVSDKTPIEDVFK